MQVELEPLPIPVHTYLKTPPGLRQDGMKPKPEVKLNALSRETLLTLLSEQHAAVLAAWEASQSPRAY